MTASCDNAGRGALTPDLDIVTVDIALEEAMLSYSECSKVLDGRTGSGGV